MRCDVIAEGIIEAARELNLSTPIVVRLQVRTFSTRTTTRILPGMKSSTVLFLLLNRCHTWRH